MEQQVQKEEAIGAGDGDELRFHGAIIDPVDGLDEDEDDDDSDVAEDQMQVRLP